MQRHSLLSDFDDYIFKSLIIFLTVPDFLPSDWSKKVFTTTCLSLSHLLLTALSGQCPSCCLVLLQQHHLYMLTVLNASGINMQVSGNLFIKAQGINSSIPPQHFRWWMKTNRIKILFCSHWLHMFGICIATLPKLFLQAFNITLYFLKTFFCILVAQITWDLPRLFTCAIL